MDIIKIKDTLKFIGQYITHPRSVGAIRPSSPALAKGMLSKVNFEKAHCIAELGPGTGVFTAGLVETLKSSQQLFVFEVNAEFVNILRERYALHPNVHIIHDSAANMAQHLAEYGVSRVEFIVSGLPFASLPAEVSEAILTAARDCLHPRGRFITFQYTLLKKRLIARYFPDIRISKVMKNLPPAYIFTCRKQSAQTQIAANGK